uniref:DUF45 domain-containing protein n=1 Tax=Fervidicoccus fontis TaxID=683846 RepID=A0A7J3ZL96_9CREN
METDEIACSSGIEVVRRRVRHLRIEVKPPGVVIVIAPLWISKERVLETIRKHSDWIETKKRYVQQASELAKKLRVKEKSHLELDELVRGLVRKYAELLDVPVPKVKYRFMKRRWASYSEDGTITMNRKAAFLPKRLIEYLIYHELCHVFVKRHNRSFWHLISMRFPDYRRLELELLAFHLKLQESCAERSRDSLSKQR